MKFSANKPPTASATPPPKKIFGDLIGANVLSYY